MDESIIIEIQDRIDASIIAKLKQIETASNKGALAVEKLKLAQTKTATANEKLLQAQNKNLTALQQLAKNTDQAALAHLRLENAQRKAQAAANRMEQSHKSVGSSFNAMTSRLIAYASAYVGIKEIFSLGNAYVDLENKLRVVTTSQEQLAQVSTQVFDIANRTRTPVEETAKAFSRFDLALIQLGKSQQESLSITETVNKALVVSGANAGEQAAALLQLSQAFNKGKLDGDEFRSVMELMPPVADAIAKQMGVTRGELLKLAPQGKITAEIMAKAFESAKETIDKSFAKTIPTLNQGLTVLKNNFTMAFGEIEKGSGALSSMSQVLIDIGKYLDENKTKLYGIGTSIDALMISLSGLKDSFDLLTFGASKNIDPLTALSEVIKSIGFTIAVVSDLIRTFVSDLAILAGALTNIPGMENPLYDWGQKTLGAKSALDEFLDSLEKSEKKLIDLNIKTADLKLIDETVASLTSQYKNLSKAINATPNLATKEDKELLKEINNQITILETKRKKIAGDSLRGPSKITNKPTEESEKARKSRLDFEAGVKIKHPEKFEPTNNAPLAESSRSVALGKVNDELDQEWSNLQRVGSEQESYNRLQQIMNDLTKAHVYLSDEEVAAYKAKTDNLVFENKINQERNKLYNENKGQMESLRVSKIALDQEFIKGNINVESYNLKLVQLGVKLAELKIKMNDATGSDIAIASFGRVISQYEGLAAGLTSTFADFFTSFQDGFADSIGKAVVEGESLNDTLHNVAKGGLSSLISGLVKLGMQWVINATLGETLSAAAISSQTALSVAAAATTATAWAPAAAMTSLASFGANSAPAMIGISSTAGLAEMLSLAAFAKGGEISGGEQLIRVNERGTETVMNAGATARNKPILAAMNAGATVGTTASVSVKIENYGTSKQFEVMQDDDNIRIIARDEAKQVVSKEVPKLVASEIANPNSTTSKSLAQNTNVARRH